MDKYRRVEKPHRNDQTMPVEPNEIRITQQGKVRSYISYGHGLFVEKNERCVVLKAMGNAISKAVTVAEILKHRVAKLHMVTRISSIETVDVYDPLEEGLDRIETKRKIPSISIQLSLDELDKDDPGYQSPIPAEQVTEGSPSYHDSREFRKTRGHNRRSGGNGGRGGEATGPAEAEETVEADEEEEQQIPNEDGAMGNTPTTRGKRGKGRGRRQSGNNGGRGKKAGGRFPAEEGDDDAVASSAAEQQVESEISPPVTTSRKFGRGRKGERTPNNGGAVKQDGEGEGDDEARENGQGNGRSARGRYFGRGRGRGRGHGRGRGRGRGRGGRGESIRRDGDGVSLAISSSDAAEE